MKTLRNIVCALALIATALPSTAAWADPLQRTDLLKNDIEVPGYQIVQVRVDFAPGSLAPRHSHPGEEVAYVLEGTLQYELEGHKSVTLSAGQTLFIPAGVVHAAKNMGTGSASELATYVVRKGEPLVAPAK
ncbi:quercetin dioxygenase-like cupin family protein [Pararhizobium capsulatum DSM 1112]|uniref:Quercetin dioxygenase-like cupin family protein n=1 Tax=Pararhizobium capsulatum DSM 1112 TaxID=1121113 RepID=A0ABU0BPU4_9HYPH|nr:cupin domain-containing protein [Pararhizobium capsulatum]MDQ0320261.1 quercetin dioxygenase-like cupin family protein [Pararhizobium capsulatum DSM 1112]